MNIILESAQFGNVSIEKSNKDTVTFITCLQSADTPNRNGRIYPKSVLEKALKAPNIQERLATHTWYGEAGHPLDTSVARQMSIDMRNIAFLIEEIWWEGNLLKGKCTTANTACGRDMKGLIEQGCKVAFSLRAQGNVHTNPVSGLVEVEDGLQILCYDFVAVPSHAQAFMEKICEATIMSMYKTSKQNLNSTILCESEDLFMQGKLLNINSTVEPTEKDYTKTFTEKFKQPSEMYRPEEDDEVKTMDLKETYIVNTTKNVTKKVLTEDYIVKDIRSRLCGLCEAPIATDGTDRWFDRSTLAGSVKKGKGDADGYYTGVADFKNERIPVVGTVDAKDEKPFAIRCFDDPGRAKRMGERVNNSLKEAPLTDDGGEPVKEKNYLAKKTNPDGWSTGYTFKNGEPPIRAYGHKDPAVDAANIAANRYDKNLSDKENRDRRNYRGYVADNIDRIHEKLYGGEKE